MSLLPTRPFDLARPRLDGERVGNTGTPGVWHFDSGLPGRRVLLTALIHGNELCGAWALKTLLASGLAPRRGSLTLAFCNLAAFDRFDPADHARS
ncbi:succinylglutamate desuccinylase/aspartoacylase family protein, partial [Bordetella hinzii]|nr:succinylglutamate desuccinylase/aspartoacylase family protein [Bordetella hinzii]